MDDRRLVPKGACDRHDDIGMANIGIDFQLLFPTQRRDPFRQDLAVAWFNHSVLVPRQQQQRRRIGARICNRLGLG